MVRLLAAMLGWARGAVHVVRLRSSNAIVRSKYAARGPVIQARVSQKAYRKRPRCLTQRASFASPHAERDVLSGVTGNRELNAFVSGPAAFVGGVPVTRARNP